MKPLSFICAWLLVLQAARGATISGIVRAKGKEGAADATGGGNYESKKLKFVQRINYEELRDFVVYIAGPVEGAPSPSKIEKIRQKDAMFSPHVLPIMVGTVVEWPNDDDIFHNVFSKSDANPFDLDLYKKGDPPKRSPPFSKPGEVDVFCSIHARMSCIILVLENPYFALADARGRYTISDVPPGRYTLVAWQERLPKDSQEITVPAAGNLSGINFTLGVKNLPHIK
jgi:plastocyanin